MKTMLDYSLFFSLLIIVSSTNIIMRGKQTVTVGTNAAFSCLLPNASGVKQVTWQQQIKTDGSVRQMVTLSERLKHQIAEPFMNKVDVNGSLNSTNIIIKNVAFADEACYVCTFNAYPSGTQRKKTCLTVEGISGTTLDVFDEEGNFSVSCSATGKPAPVVNWNITENEQLQFLTEYSVVNNTDGTTTITSKLRLPRSEFQNKYVECSSQSGNMDKIKKVIHLEARKELSNTDPAGASRQYLATMICVALTCLLVVSCIVIVYVKRKHHVGNFFKVSDV